MSETTSSTITGNTEDETQAHGQQTIIATPVPEEKRLDFLPSHFNIPQMMQFESLVFQFAKHILPDYKGGDWEFVSLSNGGLILFPGREPEALMRVEVHSNGYEGELTAQAAGVIVTLFALCYLGEMDCDGAIGRYHLLRDFIFEQPYGTEVLRAID